jgi:hypothetical protein
MNSLRLRIGTAVLSVLAAALLAAATPEVSRGLSNCTASQLVPALGDVTVNQGLGNYAYRVRGKDTLVKFFLTNPTTCAVTSTQSINVTGATLTVSTAPSGSPTVGAFQSFAASPALSASVSTNSPADPVFAVPGTYLTPTATDVGFTPTFTATVTYSRKSGNTTTAGFTATFTNSSATFDHLTRALRVLVVPMGDATPGVLANTQYTLTDQASTQNGITALSRILPVPGGVGPLGGTGGIRYTIDLSAMVNLKAVTGAYLTDGRFCGSSGNFDLIKAQLAEFLRSWNSNPLNANKQADRVLGVVGESKSAGADYTGAICADGMASVVSPEAWVRVVADKPAAGKTPAVPSRTGSLMAMELSHTWGGEPTSTHHSTNVSADVTNPGRAYNVTTRAFLSTNRSVMKYSFVSSPPWDDTLTLLEPADYAYDLCALGGTTTSSCTSAVGTTLGVAAGPSFVVSGTVHTSPILSADIVQSGFATSPETLRTDADPNSLYRYVRRDSVTGHVETNLGFIVSFVNTLHGQGASENDDPITTDGLFSFALPDALPPPDSDLAEVQLWKVSSLDHDPGAAIDDTLLYDKTQQPVAPQDLGFNTLSAGQPDKYTDTAGMDEVHPALSDDGNWIAWEAPSVPGTNVIHVAPAASSANAITLPVPAGGTGVIDAFPAWNHSGDWIAYAFEGDLYKQEINTSGATASVIGDPVLIYDSGAGPAAHHPSWAFDGESIAFEAGADIYKIPSGGGTATQLTHDTDAHDPSWSHTLGADLIAYTRGPENCGTSSAKLYVVTPSGTRTSVGNVNCSLFPSFGTNGRIAFTNEDGNIWSLRSDGSDSRQLTIGGQDSFPSTAGNILAFDRLFATGCEGEICLASNQQDIMLTSLTASGNTAFSAVSNVPLKAEVDHEVNGTAYPAFVGLDPDEVNGAIQTWYINFDGSNAPSGGVLRTLFTDGVQYTTGSSTVVPTVDPKPPTAAIYSPPDTSYPQGATFALNGSGYDAEGRVLPAENLHWTLTLPNGTVQNLGNFASKDLKAPLPAGWPGGTLTFTLVASDGSLNSAPVTRNVHVLFGLVGDGFLPPIKNPPEINIAKTGTQYPIKWQLKDASGRYISDLNTVAPAPQGVAYQSDGNPPTCDFANTNGPFTPLPTGSTVLRYDKKNNQFVYNWTTPPAPGCYIFQVTLTDGSEHQAWFQLS